jgi:dihydroorotase
MKQKYELLLKGGRLIDPANGLDGIYDIAISGGKVEKVEKDIADLADKTVNLSGYIVTPGLIDCHCHIYPSFPQQKDKLYNINADAHMLQAGVVTAIDAGTCGWRDFFHFKEQVIDQSEARVLAMLNIAAGGMVQMASEQKPSEFNKGVVAEIAKAYSDIVVAVKTAHYWTMRPFDAEHPPWASVEASLEAAEMCGKPLMVDFYPYKEQRTYRDLLKRLRKGDIHTHMYAQQFPVLNKEMRVNDFILEARERGVLFDLGHGAGSFWFRNAVPAYRDGFGPDTLSSDLYMENIHGAALNVLNIMSKYLCIGMPLNEVIARTTVFPAKIFGHPELGNLSVGSCADIAVLKLLEGSFSYADCGNARLNGDKKLECVMTLRNGKIVFDPGGLSMPLWEEAPAAYWTSPGVL